MLQDLKFGLRALRAAPSSTAAAVFIIALGTGVNAAVFSITYGILLRPLPYPDAARLVVMSIQVPDGSDTGMLLDEFEDWRGRLRTIEAASAYASTELTVKSSFAPRRVKTAVVTDAFFEVLGAPPTRGRTISNGDEVGAVAISSRLARQMSDAFNDEPLGSQLTIGTRAYTVAAVMPPSFSFPNDSVDAWIQTSSLGAADSSAMISNIGLFRIVARLRRDVTLLQTREDVLRATREIRGEGFGNPQSARPTVTPIEDIVVGSVRLALRVSMAASILVLLVASANVATLLLERVIARDRQLAVKMAVGASRWRLVRGILIESLFVAEVGSALGVAADLIAVPAFARAAHGAIPRIQAVTVDLPVLLFCVVVAFVVTLLSGFPAVLRVSAEDFMQRLGSVRSTVTPTGRRLTLCANVRETRSPIEINVEGGGVKSHDPVSPRNAGWRVFGNGRSA